MAKPVRTTALLTAYVLISLCSCTQRDEETVATDQEQRHSVAKVSNEAAEVSPWDQVAAELLLNEEDSRRLSQLKTWGGSRDELYQFAPTEKTLAAVEQLARRGDPQFQFALGSLFELGLFVEKNETEAARWYRTAYEQNYAPAQHAWAWSLIDGSGVAKDEQQGFEMLKANAENGFLRSDYSMGHFYLDGRFVAEDKQKALECFKNAATADLPIALLQVGYCISQGWGTEQDPAEASRWYKRAADFGNSQAMRNLGSCYMLGLGVEQNLETAKSWFEKASDRGELESKAFLAAWLFDGTLGPRDRTKAKEMLQQNVDLGHEPSKQILAQIVRIEQQEEINRKRDEEIISGDFYFKQLEQRKREIDEYYSDENMMRRAYDAASRPDSGF